MSVFGPFGEILVGTLYFNVFGVPLWQYRILPVHAAYTSMLAPLVWGVGGLVTFFIHECVLKNKYSTLIHAVLITVELLIVEFIINGLYLLITDGYIFYYFPGDLRHIVSLQTLPIYFMVGIATTISMQRFRKDPIFFSVLSVAFMFVLVFLA